MNLRIIKYLIPWKIRKGLFGGINYLRELPERLSFQQKLRKHVPLLVLQMGKVGSTAIANSLAKYYPGVVVHCHNFKENHRNNWRIPRLYRYWKRTGCPMKIITPIREPVSRQVSAYFHERTIKDKLPLVNKPEKYMEQLKEDLIEHYGTKKFDTWFDKQLLAKFGIDVFSKTFPKTLGYQEFVQGGTKALILQIELPDHEKERIIKNFTGLPEFHLRRAKEGTRQEYGHFYRYFKQHIKLPAEYVNTLLNSRFFKHFYSASQRNQIIKRWTARDEANE